MEKNSLVMLFSVVRLKMYARTKKVSSRALVVWADAAFNRLQEKMWNKSTDHKIKRNRPQQISYYF